jgi:tRNA/tmRNA/rRNA uracil-C5-methylase (TrmA/RlmC/RlmD family)
VTIERILPGGVGLAHAAGKTLFVTLAAPGDVVRVRVDRVRGKVAFASIEEVITPSPVRVEPPCPYFGTCGGCDFQQLDYQAQLDAKVAIVRDCLRRIAHVESLPRSQLRRHRVNGITGRGQRALTPGLSRWDSLLAAHHVCDELNVQCCHHSCSRLSRNCAEVATFPGDLG